MALTFKHGKSSYLKASITGSTVTLSSGLDEISWDRTVDTAEVTTFGDGDKNFLPGLRDSSFSLNGHWASTYELLIDGWLGSSSLVTITYGPQGNTTGFPKRTQSAIMTSLGVSNPVGDKVSMSIAFQGTGAVSTGVF